MLGGRFGALVGGRLGHDLSTWVLFAYGALGGFVALVAVQVLPAALKLAGGADLSLTVPKVLGLVLVFAIFSGLGGFVAFLVGDATQAKQAVFYGLGWQGTLGGFIQGAL